MKIRSGFVSNSSSSSYVLVFKDPKNIPDYMLERKDELLTYWKEEVQDSDYKEDIEYFQSFIDKIDLENIGICEVERGSEVRPLLRLLKDTNIIKEYGDLYEDQNWICK